jgi:hypothetical protein
MSHLRTLTTEISASLSVRLHNLATRARYLADDRGDVPGWVLVAVMTAGLVTAIWLIADDRLTSVLDGAISSVSVP